MVVVVMTSEMVVTVAAQGVLLDCVLSACTVTRTWVDKQVDKLVECIAVHRMACKLSRNVVVEFVLKMAIVDCVK